MKKGHILLTISTLALFLGICFAPVKIETIEAIKKNEPKIIKDLGDEPDEAFNAATPSNADLIDLSVIPEYSNEPFVILNDNNPSFSDNDKIRTDPFETYSNLDSFGRCGVAYANICKELQPTEEREPIGAVKPSGWHTAKYAEVIPDLFLYNRCHLIGYQLAGENANTKNLITGTRYLNVDGMLPFENMIDDYVDSTGNHVLYRVTPIFEGENLVASGVQMEAYSVEDNGKGISFNIYCYNVQPYVEIDYATGDSKLCEIVETVETIPAALSIDANYVLNTNTKRFHYPTCDDVEKIKAKNRSDVTMSRDEIIAQGYKSCGNCHP